MNNMLNDIPLICFDIIAHHIACQYDYLAAQDAASLCLVGNNVCKALAYTVYETLDPGCTERVPIIHDCVTSTSKLSALRAACRFFGCPVSGNKSQLWDRLECFRVENEKQGRAKDACPVRDNVRVRIQSSQKKSLIDKWEKRFKDEYGANLLSEVRLYSSYCSDLYLKFV